MMRKHDNLLLRVSFYVLGMFILALGVSLSVLSGLGVSPVSSIPYIVSKLSGLSLGQTTTIVFSVYVLAQIALRGKDFKPIQFLQVACALLFGRFVSITSQIISGFEPSSYLVRIMLIIVSTVLIALGIHLYLAARIVPQASEGLVQTIAEKGEWEIANIKNWFDILSVGLACIISLIAFGKIEGIREGTFVTAIGVGRVMKVIRVTDNGRLNAFLYGESLESERRPNR